jgi:hypothetical protein
LRRCEFKKVRDTFTDQHMDAMEWAIAENIGVQWRHRKWGKGIKETAQSGAFINGIAAAGVLVRHMETVASAQKMRKDQMEFAINRAPTRTAALTCMQRLSSSVLGTRGDSQ